MLRAFGELFGDQTGTGTPRVLALPGWMRGRADLAGALEGLPAVALDLPGFGGASPEPAEPTGSAGYADAVEAALAACEAPVVVVGHSFGGRVAVHLAARHPDRVGALVLTGAPLLFRSDRPRPARPSVGYRLLRWANRRRLVSDARMETERRKRGSADYANASGVMRGVLVAVVNEEYRDQLAAVRCPVWFVWGADDADVPVSTAERAMALLPDPSGQGRLQIVPGAGHLLPVTHPRELRRAVVAALAHLGALA